jgi:hypothetical protein
MNGEQQEMGSDVKSQDNDEDNDTDNEADEGGIVPEEDRDNEVTDESEGEGEGATHRDWRAAEITEIGETVWCGKEDDPGRQCWRRVDGINVDARTEETRDTRLKNVRITDNTTELEMFWALMPLKEEELLKIVRDGADKEKSRLGWEVEHIHAALCVIFGGAQFKDMTDLWSAKRKGMMPAPDFGLYLSRDRFRKKLRYWARGPDGTSEKLRNNPWEEVDYWVRAFNKNRREEIEVGTNVTPDETSILHCMFQGLPVSPSTTNKWVPLIVTIFIAKAFCDSTWPGEPKMADTDSVRDFGSCIG